jgi:hypothetical protein
LSKEQKSKYQPFAEKPMLAEEGYSVVNVSNNKQFNGMSSFGSEAMARDYLEKEIAKDRSQRSKLHVVPNYEMNKV